MGKFRIAVRKFEPFENTLKKLWDAFCLENNQNIEVEMIPMELHELYEEIITKKGLQNGDWDVAHINTDWILDAVNANAVENLSPLIAQDPPQDFPEGWHNSLLHLQEMNGNIYGLPFHDGPECLIYRKDLFEDASEKTNFKNQYGYDLTPPKTWQEFTQIAEFFNRPDENLYGCVFANYPDAHNMVFDFSLQLWTRGGSLLDSNKNININTPEAIKALEFYRAIVKNEKTTHPGSEDFESIEAGMTFAKGEAAMAINWFGFASMCEVIEASKVKGKVDIAELPHNEDCNSASLNVYWLYSIGSGSKNKTLAYDFLRFATRPESDKLLTNEGGIGCRKSTWNDSEINKTIPYYHKLGMLHENALTLPQTPVWPKVAELIDKMVLQAITSHVPTPLLLKTTQNQIQEVFEYKPLLPETEQPIIIVGASGIVKDAHLPAYKMAGFKVYGITNRTVSKANKMAEDHGIPYVFKNVADAVKNAPDNAVYDITVLPDQYVEILELLPDGAAVLIQKPMGNDYKQAKEIVEVCERKNLVAAINFQLRFASFVSAARNMIDKGLIGDLYDMEFKVTVKTPWELFPVIKKHPRLEILFHSVHYIDCIRSFLGNPERVMARTTKHPLKDLSSCRSTIIMDYGDNISVKINTNHDHDFSTRNQESYIKWEGTKGAIKAKMGLLMNYPDGLPDTFEYVISEEGKELEWKTLELEGSWFPEAFIGTMSNLMRFKEGTDKELYTSVQDVLDTMKVVEACYISDSKGGVSLSEL
ncbi:extracellular solute-binding protein [Flavisericum labens]|uniref:extracellular solute-binding protein n=1 Tax=Flavisericum labens TaxID=3377112 RepID=UPI00387B9A10